MHHHSHTEEPSMLDQCDDCDHLFRAGRDHDCSSEGDVSGP